VGPSSCSQEIRKRINGLRDDGFLIESTPEGSLVLAGNGRNGTSFAVYKFLERFAGIRWLWPGESGEVIPKKSTLALDPVSMEQEPAYAWRNLGPEGPLWGPMDKWASQRRLGVSVHHQRLEELWEMHNGLGGVRIYGGHSWGQLTLSILP
jgi:hypothetical protein